MSTLTEGLSTAIIGMLVVFLGLILLIAIISLMRVFSKDNARGKKAAQPEAVPAAVAAAPEQPEETADEGAVVAAIAAAISMMLEKEGGNSSFIVRRVVRRGLKARASINF